MRSAKVLGISDKVFKTAKQKKETGHVFFFEIDNHKAEFYDFLKATRFEWYVLRTKKGYHFICFEVMSCSLYLETWANFIRKFPKSDYNHNISNKILRLGYKGKSKPPEFIFRIISIFQKNYSKAHFNAYVKAGIIPKEYIPAGKPISTKARLCVYTSKKRLT